jgi:hypothetical protein
MSVPICWSLVTALPSMTRHAAGAVDFVDIEQSGCRRIW